MAASFALPELNWSAALVGALFHMLIGAAWYAIFAKPWRADAMPGWTEDRLRGASKAPYAVAASSGLVTAVVLGALLHGSAAADTVPEALWTALLAWLAFVGVTFATTYAFERRPWRLWAIDAGYHLASLLAMATVVGWWP